MLSHSKLCRYFSVAGFEGVMQFEQDPNQILDALLPLYMNSQILRALQESLASEVGRCTS